MTQMETVAALEAAMSAEIACFEAYVAAQRSFIAAMKERDWKALETAIGIQDELTRAIAAKEAERVEAFERLRADSGCDESGMYRVALCVPEPQRSELTDLYRRLKLAAMRAKFENASAADYAAGNRDLLKAVLEELFPQKKHRNYGKSGKAVQVDLDAILLNTTL
jgi:FlgN protein.